MKGAIIGDIVGSGFEFSNTFDYNFPFFAGDSEFTDDSAMTCAVALKFLKDAKNEKADMIAAGPVESFTDALYFMGNRYPYLSYGGRFRRWLREDDPQPYGSWGNGAPMRSSPAGYVAKSAKEAYDLGVETALPTHNHPEGMRAAGLTAELVWRARNGETMEQMKERAREEYAVENVIDGVNIIKGVFYVDSMKTMPVALQAFFDSTSFEDAIRKAVSFGGDSDTIGAITGAIAEAYYGVDEDIWNRAKEFLPVELAECIVEPFYDVFVNAK